MGNTNRTEAEKELASAVTDQPRPVYGGPAFRRVHKGMLYFVRHGEAEHNPGIKKAKASDPVDKHLLASSRAILDPSLTPTGEKQARALRSQCEQEGLTFDVLVTTPLARAMQTAALGVAPLMSGEGQYLVVPECTETSHSAHTHLGNAQKGQSIESMRAAHPFLADTTTGAAGGQAGTSSTDSSSSSDRSSSSGKWDLSGIEEGTNWVEDGEGWVHPLPAEERLEGMRALLLRLAGGAGAAGSSGGISSSSSSGQDGKAVVVVGHSGVFDKLVGVSMGNCEVVRMTAQDFAELKV